MIFSLDGILYTFSPIKDFRAAHHLPPEFGIAQFQPKDYAGLGRIDRAGAELNAVRSGVLGAIPERISMQNLLSTVDDLTRIFENQLMTINPQVGLREAEIGFAVAGFSDVCQAWVYALLRARASKAELPDFPTVYRDWLNSTIRLFSEVYIYPPDWRIQVVAHAYGRMGLLIHTPDTTYAVYDPSLACPAEGFMTALLGEVCERLVG
ncbi:MAG: hypothetical protein K8L97_19605 [Anaerolineae bacterium]|nr:hypothetical protein [Anaerolineae bacterium]